MTAEAIKMAEEARIHPFRYLLQVVEDETVPIKDRLFASAAALPYCLSKRATQLHVTSELSGESIEELQKRLLSVQQERLQLGSPVIEGEAVRRG